MGLLASLFAWRYRSPEGREEDVPLQRWTWEAYFQDGKVLKQYDDQGWFHRSDEVDPSLLRELRIFYRGTPWLTLQWHAMWSPGIRFTYLRRRRLLEHGTSREHLITAGVFTWSIGDVEIYAVGTDGGQLTLTTNLDAAPLE